MKKIFASFLLIIGLVLIGGGTYLTYLSNPKVIFSTALKEVNSKASKVFDKTKNAFYQTDFTTKSDIKLDIKSEYLNMMATNDPEYTQYNNLLNNLNNTTNSLIISQDKDNKMLLANFNSTLNNEELIGVKYLIEGPKQYCFLNNFLDSYIDAGENNYFEALEESLSVEDISYLYEVIMRSIENNMKDEYFTKSNEKEFYKVTFNLTEKVATELIKAVISDLRTDKQANEIITSLYKDFFKEVDEAINGSTDEDNSSNTDVTLDKTIENYIINIYTDKLTYEIKKYEIIYMFGNKEDSSIIYEKGTNKDLITLKQEGKASEYLEIIEESGSFKIDILDESKKKLGSVHITITDTITNITLIIENDDTNIDFSYKSEIKNKTDKSFDSDITISLKADSEGVSIVDGTITLTNNVTKEKPSIDEDISNATILNDEQNELLSQKLMGVLLKLMS